ncbi:hypothetical protein CDAR_59171, partial [Caerostris darwini]
EEEEQKRSRLPVPKIWLVVLMCLLTDAPVVAAYLKNSKNKTVMYQTTEGSELKIESYPFPSRITLPKTKSATVPRFKRFFLERFHLIRSSKKTKKKKTKKKVQITSSEDIAGRPPVSLD